MDWKFRQKDLSVTRHIDPKLSKYKINKDLKTFQLLNVGHGCLSVKIVCSLKSL